jgi:hypothetical protein
MSRYYDAHEQHLLHTCWSSNFLTAPLYTQGPWIQEDGEPRMSALAFKVLCNKMERDRRSTQAWRKR